LRTQEAISRRWGDDHFHGYKFQVVLASTRFGNFKSISSIFFTNSGLQIFRGFHPSKKKVTYWQEADEYHRNRETTRFGNNARIASVEALAACAVAPSCRNHKSCRPIRLLSSVPVQESCWSCSCNDPRSYGDSVPLNEITTDDDATLTYRTPNRWYGSSWARRSRVRRCSSCPKRMDPSQNGFTSWNAPATLDTET